MPPCAQANGLHSEAHPRQQLLRPPVGDEVGSDGLRGLCANDVGREALLRKGRQRPSSEEEDIEEEAVTAL